MTRLRAWKEFVLGRLGRRRAAGEGRGSGGEGRRVTGARDRLAYLPGPDGVAMTRDRAGERHPGSSGPGG